MHNRDQYPEIWAAKEKAEKELKPLMQNRKAHTDNIALVQLDINILKNKKEELNTLAMKDASRIASLREIVARMAKAMGAK